MAKQGESGIGWCDETWNPLRGCSRVSEGCRNCYAEGVASRFSGPGQPYEGLAGGGKWTGKTMLVEKHLTDPLRWRRPRRIFVNSMSDLFHESVPDEWIDRIFAVMALAKQHVFQVLTKRPERMLKYVSDRDRERFILDQLDRLPLTNSYINGWPRSNIWLGVSIEDQATADERIPLLLKTPAAVRFVSAEPLLGSVEIRSFMTRVDGIAIDPICDDCEDRHEGACEGLDWVIVGGESGPNARPMHPDWARSLRDQCVEAGVSYFFKQWGEWLPFGANYPGAKWVEEDEMGARSLLSIKTDGVTYGSDRVECDADDSGIIYARVGKKLAGRQIDGKTWDEMPESAQ